MSSKSNFEFRCLVSNLIKVKLVNSNFNLHHRTLSNSSYNTVQTPVNIVGEGEGDGEHLVQGDQGDRQDGRAAGHPEHEAYTAMTKSSLKIFIFRKSSKLLTCIALQSYVSHDPRTPLTPGLGLVIDHQSMRYYCQARRHLFTHLVKLIHT